LHRAGVVRIKDIQEKQPEPGSPRAIQAAVTELLDAGQYEGALSLLTASLQVFPENADLQQLSAKAEAGFLEHVYQSRISPGCVPQLIVPFEEAMAREDLGPNERFILDLANKGTWNVKAMTRIAPLHEVDVVRASVNLLEKNLIELKRPKKGQVAAEPQVDVMGEELRRLSGEVAPDSVETTIDDVLGGSAAPGSAPEEAAEMVVGSLEDAVAAAEAAADQKGS